MDHKKEIRKLNTQIPNVNNAIWLTVSESAKIGGVRPKTIRRAIKSKTLRYKIVKERYLIDLKTLIMFMHSSTKLRNKFNNNGLGQYVRKWKKV